MVDLLQCHPLLNFQLKILFSGNPFVDYYNCFIGPKMNLPRTMEMHVTTFSSYLVHKQNKKHRQKTQPHYLTDIIGK